MERPAKRQRTGGKITPLAAADEEDELILRPEEINRRRDPGYQAQMSNFWLRSRFEEIFEKYGNPDLASDEISLKTGEVVTDNGHIQNLGSRHVEDAVEGLADTRDELILRGTGPAAPSNASFLGIVPGISQNNQASANLLRPLIPLDPFGLGAARDPKWQVPELTELSLGNEFQASLSIPTARKTTFRAPLLIENGQSNAENEEEDEEDDDVILGVPGARERASAAKASGKVPPTSNATVRQRKPRRSEIPGAPNPPKGASHKPPETKLLENSIPTNRPGKRPRQTDQGQQEEATQGVRVPRPRGRPRKKVEENSSAKEVKDAEEEPKPKQVVAVKIRKQPESPREGDAPSSTPGQDCLTNAEEDESQISCSKPSGQTLLVELSSGFFSRHEYQFVRQDAPSVTSSPTIVGSDHGMKNLDDEGPATVLDDEELPDATNASGSPPPSPPGPIQPDLSPGLQGPEVSEPVLQNSTSTDLPDIPNARDSSGSQETTQSTENTQPTETTQPKKTTQPTETSKSQALKFRRNVIDPAYDFSDDDEPTIRRHKQKDEQPSMAPKAVPGTEEPTTVRDPTQTEYLEASKSASPTPAVLPETSETTRNLDSNSVDLPSFPAEEPPKQPNLRNLRSRRQVLEGSKAPRDTEGSEELRPAQEDMSKPAVAEVPDTASKDAAPDAAKTAQDEILLFPTAEPSPMGSVKRRYSRRTSKTLAQPSTPAKKTQAKTAATASGGSRPPSSIRTSVLSLISSDNEEDELSLGPDAFSPTGRGRRGFLGKTPVLGPTTSAVRASTLTTPLVDRAGGDKPRTPRRATGFLPLPSSRDGSAKRLGSLSNPRSGGGARRVAGTPTTPGRAVINPAPEEELYQTPGGTVRRCGEAGFKCERDFCLTCE